MTDLADQFMDWLVGDRCPADPCASKNGLKTRTYGAVIIPTIALVIASTAIGPGPLLARVLMGGGAAWFTGTLLFIPRKINELEPCDEVDSHYNEDAA